MKKIMLDLHRIAIEIVGSIATEVQMTERVGMILFDTVMSGILYEIQDNIRRKSEARIRPGAGKCPYDSIHPEIPIDAGKVMDKILNHSCMRLIISLMDTEIACNTWEVWAVVQVSPATYMLECYGDYRIIQWHEEHGE